jgi:DnaJ-domain-containing protein 1
MIVSSDDDFERARNSVQVLCERFKDQQDKYREDKNGAGANAMTVAMRLFRTWCRQLGLLGHPLDVNLDSGVGKSLTPDVSKNETPK